MVSEWSVISRTFTWLPLAELVSLVARCPDINVRFGPKVGQIVPKFDKSGTFSDQISVNFGSENFLTIRFHR